MSDVLSWSRIACSLVVICIWGGLAVANAQDVPASENAAASDKTQSKTEAPADRAGSVQAGIQTLVNKLVADMQLTDDGTFTRIAVMPFETTTEKEDEKHLGQVSAALLSSRLGAKPSIIQVERARLDAVISELKRTENGEVNPKGAVSVGKLLGASNVVLGTVAPSGADFLLTARVVDSETGRIVSMADHSFPRSGLVALSADLVEVKTKQGAAMRSGVVPGWGQFYNGEEAKGITYTTTFLALAAGAATSVILGNQHAERYQSGEEADVQYRQKANDQYAMTNNLLFGLAGVWAIAIVDAYWNGRDATTIDVEQLEMGAAGLGGDF